MHSHKGGLTIDLMISAYSRGPFDVGQKGTFLGKKDAFFKKGSQNVLPIQSLF